MFTCIFNSCTVIFESFRWDWYILCILEILKMWQFFRMRKVVLSFYEPKKANPPFPRQELINNASWYDFVVQFPVKLLVKNFYRHNRNAFQFQARFLAKIGAGVKKFCKLQLSIFVRKRPWKSNNSIWYRGTKYACCHCRVKIFFLFNWTKLSIFWICISKSPQYSSKS